MRSAALCMGIGGLDLAVEQVYGTELAWCSEYEAAPSQVIERRWPGVPNLGDLTQIDWTSCEPVDVLTAGYPCQPFSHAGKRKGTSDVRHLWPFIAEAVRVLRPGRVVLENVAGHLSLGFGDVLRDLAEAGFDAEWCVLRASDVGACHGRARLFVVARDADGSREDALTAACGSRHTACEPGGRPPADAADLGHERGGEARRRGDGPTHDDQPPADAGGERYGGGEDAGAVGRVDRGDASQARERERSRPVAGDRSSAAPADVAWGQYEPAIRRWERVLGRSAPTPTDAAGRLNPVFVEWMQGYHEGWVDGLTRTQALKALGNSVCQQQAVAAIREMEASA